MKLKEAKHKPSFGIKEILKYMGPGLLVTVGFIDPGNWASNIAAGSEFGYVILWTVTLGTIMLVLLQHNVAHLGIATGDCLAEATMKYLKPNIARIILGTATLAVVSTALAEILGAAIALQILFGVPLRIGSILVLILIIYLLLSNNYAKLEKIIIGFVSIIGIAFLYEIGIANVDWTHIAKSWVTINIPYNSMPVIMAVLGAVVMPHNLYLHSEIIQSRQWNKEDDIIIRKQLKYEFTDTLISMIIGWAINSSMIILAAAIFFKQKDVVTELGQAEHLLVPLLGGAASVIFGIALLFSGISAAITAGMAGGTICAGFFKEPYDIKDSHTKIGVTLILIASTIIIFAISDPFKGLIYSQMILSVQLPIAVFSQIYLTSSKDVMGKYKNSLSNNIILISIGIILTVLNLILFKSLIS